MQVCMFWWCKSQCSDDVSERAWCVSPSVRPLVHYGPTSWSNDDKYNCNCKRLQFAHEGQSLTSAHFVTSTKAMLHSIAVPIFVDILVELTNTVSETKIKMTIMIGRRGPALPSTWILSLKELIEPATIVVRWYGPTLAKVSLHMRVRPATIFICTIVQLSLRNVILQKLYIS